MGLGQGLQSGRHRPLTCAIWSAKTDSTGLLGALLDAGVQNACFGPLVDPQTVLQLQGHAFGERVQIRLGGKTDPRFGGAPFALTCTLVSLSADGNCIGSRAMIGGLHCSWGPMAAVQVDRIEILVVEHPGADAEPAAVPGLRHRPCSQARGGAHIDAALLAGFEPIAGEVIVCDSGALCTLNYALLLYAKLPRPMFPLDSDIDRHRRLVAPQRRRHLHSSGVTDGQKHRCIIGARRSDFHVAHQERTRWNT